MEELIGKQLNALYISEDKRVLLFETDDGDFYYQVHGDMSEQVRFQNLSGLSNLIGSQIINVVDGTWDATYSQDEELMDELFDIDVITMKGISNITVQNLHYNDSIFRAAFVDQLSNEIALEIDFEEIKKDF